MGKTKIFIRNPTTLFYFEEKREAELPRIVSRMQAAWRGYIARSKWAMRKAVLRIQNFYRVYRVTRYCEFNLLIFYSSLRSILEN